MITDSLFLMYVAGGLFGLVAGFFMHRSDYCVAGMFRDIFLFKKSSQLRALFLQIVLTMLVFEAARLLGLLPLYPFPLLGAASLANIIGGFLFGVGMVLAGGCVVGTLYKMGAGSLVSGCAFVGLIIGSGIYAEIHPWWASVIKKTSFLTEYKTIPQLLGVSPVLVVIIITVLTLPLFNRWRSAKDWGGASPVRGYVKPWKTAVVLSAIGLFSYLLLGMPMGITTTYAKIAAMIEYIVAPDHVEGMAFFQGVPLDVVHPFGEAHMLGGAGPLIDYIWALQFPLIVGIVAGSFISAIILREFRLYWKVPPYQFFMTLVGGIILGLASRLVPGCNVWHLMGGIPILALQSTLFLVGLLPGAWVGGKIFISVHKEMSGNQGG